MLVDSGIVGVGMFEDYGFSLESDFPTKNGSASLITAALHQILPLKCNAEVGECFYTRVTQENIVLCFLILKSNIIFGSNVFFYVMYS